MNENRVDFLIARDDLRSADWAEESVMIKMRRSRSAVLCGIVITLSNIALITPSSAATEGDLGAVSSGMISITASVAPKLEVLGIQGSFPLERDELSLNEGCIASNMLNRSYGVSAHQRSGMLRLAWSDGVGTTRELPASTKVEAFPACQILQTATPLHHYLVRLRPMVH